MMRLEREGGEPERILSRRVEARWGTEESIHIGTRWATQAAPDSP
jgi:hypothetical protein